MVWFNPLLYVMISFFILLSGCLSEQNQESNSYKFDKNEKAEDKDAPKLIVENPVFNFGTIKTGEKIKHVFYIKNIGNTPLIINNAFPSCGCTVASHPNRPILPNQRDSIVTTFSSESEGVQNKSINISSNDKSVHKLTLMGKVI